ncbi:hypothetical protein CAEBREN_17432 [Caenorhabditis brenneri]|uniref:Uncharacterized protein n=1 Tax=Caenorhabditis brenneri TaxID=135651 RepID=G0NX58_CAEBE|nr:hypothetical protein CAEBREN_17432 [Caenorhabditis brenneri]
MCKIFVIVALLAVVYAHPAMPSADEVKAQLIAAGISETAAAGLVAIGENHKSEIEAAKGDHEAGKKVFETLKSETDAYIKTQSEADQTAYAAFVEKKQEEIKAHKEKAAAATSA